MLELSKIERVDSIVALKATNADYRCVIVDEILREHMRFSVFVTKILSNAFDTNYYILDTTNKQLKYRLQESNIIELDDLFKSGPGVIVLDHDNDVIVYKNQASLEADLAQYDSDVEAFAYEISAERSKYLVFDMMQEMLDHAKSNKTHLQKLIVMEDENIARLQNWLDNANKEESK